jgi:phosphatidylinositol alpha-1,6-mannosyltransferase
VVLCVGRLVERKGQDVLIRSLPQVAAAVPEVLCVLAGSGADRSRLEELARDLGVADRVCFLGFVPETELPGCYAAADVFAMPSRYLPSAGDVEGFGIVFLEANAAGVPVVGGRSGGVEEAVRDGYTGLLVDPEDPAAVAGALTRLLQDEGLRRQLGAQGRERARLDFDRRQRARHLWEACR